MSKKMKYGVIIVSILALAGLFIGHYAMKNPFAYKEFYHDTILAENVTFTPDWKEIDVRGLVKVEGDRQMVGVRLKAPYWIDFDVGELKSGDGQIVHLEIRLVNDKDKIYPMYFGNARGKELVSYRPETPLPREEVLEKIQIRCNLPFEAERVIWTTYNIKDMK